MQTSNQEIKSLDFKWTESKARDTYGYAICTLFVDGVKMGRCNGGGYDMKGTSFAEWIQNKFQDRLLVLFEKEISSITDSDFRTYESDGKTKKYLRKSCKDYYGVHLSEEKGKIKVIIDGACGFTSVESVARAIGIELKWNPNSDRMKNNDLYTAIINN